MFCRMWIRITIVRKWRPVTCGCSLTIWYVSVHSTSSWHHVWRNCNVTELPNEVERTCSVKHHSRILDIRTRDTVLFPFRTSTGTTFSSKEPLSSPPAIEHFSSQSFSSEISPTPALLPLAPDPSPPPPSPPPPSPPPPSPPLTCPDIHTQYRHRR